MRRAHIPARRKRRPYHTTHSTGFTPASARTCRTRCARARSRCRGFSFRPSRFWRCAGWVRTSNSSSRRRSAHFNILISRPKRNPE
ncbi:MAG: hypothetical protein KJ726_09555, partial [Verrucomicrobia bacterium]|nr:hypothetical protein [Verrucomicrobiota bacterium]